VPFPKINDGALCSPKIIRTLAYFLLAGWMLPVTASEEINKKYDRDQALAISQAAVDRKVDDHHFLDENKNPVSISDFRGKPLVVSLIYTSCHHICPTITKNLAEIVKVSREALGDDSFSVITVGFDSLNDTPERMRLYSRERNIDIPGWHFLSADESTINTFSAEMGFIFFPSPQGFDHLSQISVLDAEGRVYRQIYGVNFNAPDLGEPLKELVFGHRSEATLIEDLIKNIKLFCTIYDPHSGRYEFDYSIFFGFFIGLLVLGAIAVFIVREWRHTNAKRS